MNEVSNKVQKTYFKCEISKITNCDTPTLKVDVIDWCLEKVIVFAHENNFNIRICGVFKM